MILSETAWQVSVDYEACGVSGDSKTRMAMARGARSAIRTAGYLGETVCSTREDALSLAQEITQASGIHMRVCEVVIGMWPA